MSKNERSTAMKPMSRRNALRLAAAGAAGFAGLNDSVADKPQDDLAQADKPSSSKFQALFNGKSLKGWKIENGARFVVEDGVIKLHGGRGWLRSKQQYKDFVLRLEVRFMDADQDGGVFLRATDDADNVVSGVISTLARLATPRYGWPRQRVEVQCRNDHTMAKVYGSVDNTFIDHQCDEDLVGRVLREPGQWNSYEIRCIGKQLEVDLNGHLVTTSDCLEPTRGYIGLQGDGGELEFLSIRIKEVDG